MRILDRYASAIRSSNLRSAESTHASDSDVIGAFGLAAKRNGLAVALQRLFGGDNHAAVELVRVMSEMVWGKARAIGVPLKRSQADDLARAALAWKRNGVCIPCHGIGQATIPGTPALTGRDCPACKGLGKVPFEAQIARAHRDIASWLLAEIERESGVAGPAAMSKLAKAFEL